MNGFNRLLVFLGCLALAAVCIAIVALAWTLPQETIDWAREAVNWTEEHNQDEEKAILSAAGAAVALLAFVVILAELWPRSSAEVKVTDLKVGDAVLSTAAVAQRVEEAVNQVPHVAEARALVKAKRKGVLVSLDLHVDPDANLADVTDQACQAARDVLTERVHVALMAPPTARLHYRELRLRGGRQPARQPLRQAIDPSLTPAHALAGPTNAGAAVVAIIPAPLRPSEAPALPASPAEPDIVAGAAEERDEAPA